MIKTYYDACFVCVKDKIIKKVLWINLLCLVKKKLVKMGPVHNVFLFRIFRVE